MGEFSLYNKCIAIFLMFIIVSTVPVYALASHTILVYSNPSVLGVVKVGEPFTVQVSDANHPVNAVINESLYPFNCQNNYTICQRQYEVLSSGEKFVDISIGEPTNTVTYSKYFLADESAPLITINDLNLSGHDLNISYSVQDIISETNQDNYSGINNIKIFADSLLLYTIPIFSELGMTNSYSRNQIITLDEPIASFNVAVYAEDNVGNYDEVFSTDELTMDINYPAIRNYFDIKQAGYILNSISLSGGQSPIVDVIVYISDNNLNSVTGDVSALNNLPTQNPGYENKVASCQLNQQTDEYECLFSNIALHPESSPIKITITATDNQDNTITQEISREFNIVSAENRVSFIGPDKESHCDDDNNCFMNSHGIIYVVIDDSDDTSFSQLNLPLKISQLSDTLDIVNPYTCEFDSSWICKYNVLVSDSVRGSKRVYIAYDATDDYGRRLNGLESSNIIMDKEAPEIINNSITSTVNDVNVIDFCLTSNDILKLSLTATDTQSSELKIWATPGDISSEHMFENKCSNQGSSFDCVLEINDFYTIAEQNVVLNVFVEDLAGNKDSFEFLMNVCEADIETTPNFITSIEPEAGFELIVDKAVASYSSWNAFIPLKFNIRQFGEDNLVTLTDYELDYCTLYDNGVEYVYNDDYYFFTKQATTAEAVVPIGGHTIDVESGTELDLICTVKASLRKGGVYYLNPQYINFTVPVNFDGYNVGGVDLNVQEDISDLIDSVNSLDRQMEARETIHTIMGNICAAAQTLAKINTVIQAIDLVLYIICLPIPGATEAVFEPFNEAVAQRSMHFTTKFIWPPGNIMSTIFLNDPCKVAGSAVGKVIKSACFIYECKFYDAQEWVSFGFSGFQNNDWGLRMFPPAPSDYVTPLQTVTAAVVSSGKAIDFDWNGDFNTEIFDTDTWLVDPYSSTYYDTLCLPAILYNMKKEKQLKCMKIKCLQGVQNAGINPEFCNEQYKFQDCLYLESAQVKEHGPFSWESFWEGFIVAAFGGLLGTATSYIFQSVCGDYFSLTGCGGFDQGAAGNALEEWGSLQDIFCSATYLTFIYSELASILNSGFGADKFDSLDGNLGNVCEGITGIDSEE